MVQKSKKMARVALALQARISSKRLPNKIFHELEPGFTVLDSCLKQCHSIKSFLKYNTDIYLLIPQEQKQIFEHVSENWAVPLVLGPEDNVLRRFENLYELKKYDYMVRLTADCPVLPPLVAKAVIEETIEKKYDYGCTKTPEDWFDGSDVECFTASILTKLSEYARKHKYKVTEKGYNTIEHVTWPIKNDPDFFSIKLYFPRDERFKDVPKLSVDNAEDLFRVIQLRKSLWWM